MLRYIQLSKLGDTDRYELTLGEILAVRDTILAGKMFEALELMFDYGRAKGYRMAKREA